ncbi:hypothetical protein GCM10009784_07950 [Arthrobacter parietis]|uniref:DUF3854 domain-containing protein n=1 Tax=Arthrobacter parietis TaxID=271434 RepID=A0ABN3AQP2_9MICC
MPPESSNRHEVYARDHLVHVEHSFQLAPEDAPSEDDFARLREKDSSPSSVTGLTITERTTGAENVAAPEGPATPKQDAWNALRRTTPDLPRWTPADYASFINGSGAAKLAGAGVAPLVAAARGYSGIDASNCTAQMKSFGIKTVTRQGRRMKRCMGESPGQDGMAMPWYSVADIQIASRNEASPFPAPFTHQVRPSHPEDNDHGKPIEYEFVQEISTPMDVHPATPVSWIDNTPVVMITEGMLTGDAALSAYLRANGVSWGDLRSAGVDNPAAKLRSLMAAIPAENRVLIVSVEGIHNATRKPFDWREINLKDRTGWIAFDADMAFNRYVHKAAEDLCERLTERSKMSELLFLNPQVVRGDEGLTSKESVDDFLAKHGTWDDLVGQLTKAMPAAPPRDPQERHGNWRIPPSGQTAEECVAINSGPGGTIGGYRWEERVKLGGRILSLETRRQPTSRELETGVFDANVSVHDVKDSTVEIEVSWNENGQDRSAIVRGPERILSFPPAEWVREKAVIPSKLLCHREWPPRFVKGEKWISAVKAHRADETVIKTKWMQMGWVPVEGAAPAFLTGDQIIGDTDSTEQTSCGVDVKEIPVAPHFGVQYPDKKTDGDFEDEEYRDLVRDDFRKVWRAYITGGPEGPAWTDEATAAIVLSAGLRPAIPLRPRSTVFFWGPPNAGKSFSAQCAMYFWARNGGDWQDQLPGAAKDTVAYIEHCVAHMPIWVVDDLAPSALRQQAEAESAKLADLTRSIFNNSPKGRMNSDMTSRKVNKPIAQLIITAENELTTPSAKERLIPAYIGPGKLNPSRIATDHINELSKKDRVQARFTLHLLRFIRREATSTKGGWGAYLARLEEIRHSDSKAVAGMMKEMNAAQGSLERTSKLAADLLLTFQVLRLLAIELDMEREFIEQFSIAAIGVPIVRLVTNAHEENKKASPGRSLLSALASLLDSGQGHIISGDDPARPPVPGEVEGADLANHKLGWAASAGGDGLRPSGNSIGTLVTLKDEKVVLFSVDTAFEAAKGAYPSLIQPGQGAPSAWAAVWNEGLAPGFIERQTNTRGTLLNTHRARQGYKRFSGVPVPLATMLTGGHPDPS